MKIRPRLISLAAVLALAASPALLMAQRAGFQIGIAQPAFGSPAAPSPAPAPRRTFVGVPAVVAVPQPIVAIQTVIIPNQVLLPGQTIVPPPGQPFPQPAPQRFVPAFTHPVPPIGTLRPEVLRQFGQPMVTVMTSTSETLYFNGGVTVIIQNGQVAGPR